MLGPSLKQTFQTAEEEKKLCQNSWGHVNGLASVPVLRISDSRSTSTANDLTTVRIQVALAGDQYFFLEQSEPNGHKHAWPPTPD